MNSEKKKQFRFDVDSLFFFHLDVAAVATHSLTTLFCFVSFSIFRGQPSS